MYKRQTWAHASGIPPTTRIQAIVAGKVEGELFAATAEGIWRSADSGKTWAVAGTGAETLNVRRLVLDPATGTIWAGAFREGILRSTDGGKSWTRVGGDPPHPDLAALALEPSGALLAGFEGGGVWRFDTAKAVMTPARPSKPKGK